MTTARIKFQVLHPLVVRIRLSIVGYNGQVPISDPPNVFVNYRRDDCGWAGVAVADALRTRLGAEQVFLDNSSIPLGAIFAREIEDAVRRCDVLLALIGPGWDRPPILDRLSDKKDWVRRELLLAKKQNKRIVPVLVDRLELPPADLLPKELQFLPGRQREWLRQTHPDDVDRLAERISGGLAPSNERGNGHDRAAIDALLRHVLPPAQKWSGNLPRLVNLALAVLSADDELRYLVPARLDDRPGGSGTALVTRTHLLVVDTGEDFLVRGEITLPLTRLRRIEVVPTLPLFADVLIHTSAGDTVALRGLFRDQAGRLADYLRGAK